LVILLSKDFNELDILYFEKILLGITLAAPIGPVTIEMIKRGLKQGFWSSFVIRIGGAMANLLCLLLAFFGLTRLNQYPLVLQVLSILGAMVLIYMGGKTLKQPTVENLPQAGNTDQSLINGLTTGFTLALVNPVGIMFWLGIFASSSHLSSAEDHMLGLTLNLLIIAGVLLWGASLSFCLATLKRWVNPNTMKWVTISSGLLLISFGIKITLKSFAII
jgi:L-lysine exporter family protein LysE/ArgO